MQQTGNIVLKADLVTLTGLHIGAGRENIEIGGIDLTVIKNPKTDLPYVPGSSVKGKMRFLTEWAEGKIKNDSVCKCGEAACPVCRIFGAGGDEKPKKELNGKDVVTTQKRGPTRLIVRDAELKEPVKFERYQDIEIKWENTIDRTTGTAKNPRPIERVVPGTVFEFELVYRIFNLGDGDTTDSDYFKYIVKALKLLENDTLGGSGSRGCGKIKFSGIVINGQKYGGSYESIDELMEKHSITLS